MSPTIKKIKGHEYLYERIFDPKTGKNKLKCLGNVKNMPVVVSPDVPLEAAYPKLSKALECDQIDAVLVEFIKEATSCYIQERERLLPKEAHDSFNMRMLRHDFEGFNSYIKSRGLPSGMVEAFQELIVRWRKSPAYEIPEIETHVTK